MRPLHSLIVVVALSIVSVGGWWLLRSNDPSKRVTAAGPAAVAPAAAGERPHEELRDVESASGATRVASEPAAAPADQPVAAAGAARASSGRELSGRVLDPEGRPVADARVLLGEGSASFLIGLPLDSEGAASMSDVLETRTDGEGRYRFADIGAEALRLAVRASGYAPYDAADVPTPSTGRLADVVLERGVVLTGRVVDAAGRAVEGVRVLRGGGASGPFAFGSVAAPVTTTAADGAFEVDVLAVGPWSLRFESEAHPDGSLSGRTERAGERVDGLLVQFDEGTTIRGRVTGQPPEGQPMERLLVAAAPLDPSGKAEAREGSVSADGSFVVRGVRVGLGYQLRAVRREGDFGRVPIEFLPGLSAAVEAEAGESGVVLALSPAAALSFQVVDASSGAALEDFTVEAGVEWPRPLTDERGQPLRHHPDGRVRVGDLRPRSSGERARLRIEALGYLPYSADGLKLAPGLDTELGTIALEPAPLLTVRVVDDETGAPIEGAEVLLSRVGAPEPGPAGMTRTIRASASFGGGGGVVGDLVDRETRRAETDADGFARVTAFEDCDVRLRVRGERHAPWASAIERAPGGAQQRDVRLTRGGTVVVHLFDASGEPQAGVRVEHRAGADDGVPPEFRAPSLSDDQGQTTFEHLAPGTHRFRRAGNDTGGVFSSGGNTFAVMVAGDEGGGDDWVEVEVAEGGVHDVEIHLPLSLALHGRVSEGGRPLADARLALEEKSEGPAGMPALPMFGGGREVSADADGVWRFDGVEPGEYTLRVTHAERAMPAEVDVRLVDLDVQRDIDLDVTVLEGRAVDEAGEPLPGVEVWAERARTPGAPRAMRVMAFAGGGGSSVMTLGEGGGGTRARTDSEGRYELRGVQAGVDLVVRGRGEGMQPGSSETVRVEVDEHRRGVDLALAVAGWIEVEGVFADGSPAVNLLVSARYEGERRDVDPQTILLDGSGKGRIEGLAPGSWRLTARQIGPNSSEAPPAETVVDVLPGKATPATLTAP